MSLEEIENNLKNLKGLDLKRIANALETQAIRSVMQNFEDEGRPVKWIPSQKKKKVSGSKTLTDSGDMSKIQAQTEFGQSGIEVTIMPGPLAAAYSRIQHEGGVINVPSRTLRFRQRKEDVASGSRRRVFAGRKHKRVVEQTSKAHTITIQARPYLVIPEEDYPDILNAVISVINL
ncbi:MAG: hypothetical protein HGGPFJEG_03072 [Ignavibacteria bacterium]|nr:hypothetical protein [Ignavibacteria bacterium]